MICFIQEVIITVVLIPVLSIRVITLWTLLQSVARWLMAADIAPLTRTPFAKVPNLKTVETLR
jgi:hypothetical protein